MKGDPWVSVVIPTYNRIQFLHEALESVLRQSFPQFEIILVDDGSDSRALQAIQLPDDRRIRFFERPHRGVSAARNWGIQQARYPWLALLDSDDLWVEGKLESQVNLLRDCPAYRAVHTEEVWYRRGRRVNQKRVHRKSGGWIYHRCLPMCRISPSSILLHREALDAVGTFDENFPVCEDYDLWLRLCARFPVAFLPQALTVKRGGHPDQLSRSRWGLDRYRVSALLKALRLDLTFQQREWTIRELVNKATLLAAGYSKRGKHSGALYYRTMAERWKPGQYGGRWLAGSRQSL